ncbi:MAG: ABC transporter substrate-binding protein [Fusobacteriaceae bacterium]
MKKLALIGCSLAFLVACGEKQGGETGKNKSDQPKKLVYAQPSDPVTLSPHEATDMYSRRVISNIFDRLVEIDEKLQIIPGLAEKWEQKDEKTMVFYLKKGVKFHNGDEMTSEDVKYSLEEAKKSPKVGTLFKAIETVETPEPYIAIIKTTEASGSLLTHLGHITASIMNKSYNANESEYMRKPSGTGAYKFKDWKAGDRITLEKYPQYFRGEPSIDIVEVRAIPEENSRVIGLETGELQISAEIQNIGRKALEGNKDVEIKEISSLGVSYIGMNVTRGAMSDIRVRQAIAMGIDRDAIIESIHGGVVPKANSILGPGVFGYAEATKYVDYNPEKAKELLKEAGKENLEIKLMTSSSEVSKQIAEVVQAQLKDIGIKMNIELLEWATFLNETANGRTDMFMMGWSNSSGDADYGMTPMLHGTMIGGAGNRSFYDNQKLNSLLDAGKIELNPEKRKTIYAEAQQIMADDIPIFPINFQIANAGVRKEVIGFIPTPINNPTFYKLSLQ